MSKQIPDYRNRIGDPYEVSNMGSFAGVPRNKYGFYDGTDLAIVASHLVEGGFSKRSIQVELEQRLGKTAKGRPKGAGLLMNDVIGRLMSKGYQIESFYRLAPPPEIVAIWEAHDGGSIKDKLLREG